MLENNKTLIAGGGILLTPNATTNEVTISAALTEVTEDAVAIANPVGTQLIARRRDTLAGEVSTDGDHVAINSTNKGELYVKHFDAVDVNVISGGTSGTEYTEGDVDASIMGNAIMMEVAGNTLQPVQGTVADGLLVNLGANNDITATDLDIRDLTATDVVTVTGGVGQVADVKVTLDSETVLLASGTNNIGDVDVLTLPSLPAGTNNIGDVDILSIAAGTNYIGKTRLTDGTTDAEVVALAGYNAQAVAIVDGSGNQITSFGGSSAGDVAHDAVDSGNPVKIGFKSYDTLPAVVANGDRVNGIADSHGRQLVSHIDPMMQIWKSHNSTTTQTGVAIWTPTSGKKVVITSIIIGTYATTTARVILFFDDDTTYNAGTDQLVLAASFAPDVATKPGLVFTPPVPIFAATVNYALRITTDAAISIDVTVYGYEI